MLHIWHEDSVSSSTTAFWKFLSIHNVSPRLVGADIQGFNGNTALLNYLKTCRINSKDEYIILADFVLDNPKALIYYRDIKSLMKRYTNVKVCELLCFEFLMLRFKYLETWVEPSKSVKTYVIAQNIRRAFIDAVEHNSQQWITNNAIVAYVVKHCGINTSVSGWQAKLSFISSEKIATWLLSDMTNAGSARFGVGKTTLGECWYKSCCPIYKKSSIGLSKCKIYKYHKSSEDKARNLWNGTLAKSIIN